MELIFTFIHIFSLLNLVTCRDFYIGMFKKQDYLVAQDYVYKERTPNKHTIAQYGRHFKCPITYFRVVDRLGTGGGPYTTIVRGGLRKNYIAVNIKSNYNQPISVNIYVGCENKTPVKYRRPKKTTTASVVQDVVKNATKNEETGTGGYAGDTGGSDSGSTPADIGEQTTNSPFPKLLKLSAPIGLPPPVALSELLTQSSEQRIKKKMKDGHPNLKF